MSQILSKETLAHFRLERYTDVVYELQYCKGIHLIDHVKIMLSF